MIETELNMSGKQRGEGSSKMSRTVVAGDRVVTFFRLQTNHIGPVGVKFYFFEGHIGFVFKRGHYLS